MLTLGSDADSGPLVSDVNCWTLTWCQNLRVGAKTTIQAGPFSGSERRHLWERRWAGRPAQCIWCLSGAQYLKKKCLFKISSAEMPTTWGH